MKHLFVPILALFDDFRLRREGARDRYCQRPCPKRPQDEQAISYTFSGKFSANSDGTGAINFKNPAGQAGPAFSFVITDRGSQLMLLRTDTNPGFDVVSGTARLQ